MRIKQSVCIPMVNTAHIPLEEFVKTVAAIGFAAVEIWMPDESFPELAALAHRHGLAISIISGHNSLAVGLNDSSQHERIEGELAHSIDLAVQSSVPGLICFSGNKLDGQSDVEAIQATVRGLKRIAPYAEKKGINLNMELLNTIVDHPGYQCNHTSWGVEVCQLVDSPRVKLLYDIYHMQIMEGNIVQTITENIRWIGHFHTAGVPGRHDLDETQELNYARIFKAIASTPYDLYVAHEYQPNDDIYASLRKTFATANQG
jgi:hydroxypyruvate isomerase